MGGREVVTQKFDKRPWSIKERSVLPKLYCIDPTCKNRSSRRGYCGKHYNRLFRKGELQPRGYKIQEFCVVDECNERHSCNGYCNLHYKSIFYQPALKQELYDILEQYECQNCGFKDTRTLQFDHINGDGYKEKHLPSSTAKLRYYVTHPDEAREKLQVLCANCNWIKRFENSETGHKWR